MHDDCGIIYFYDGISKSHLINHKTALVTEQFSICHVVCSGAAVKSFHNFNFNFCLLSASEVQNVSSVDKLRYR